MLQTKLPYTSFDHEKTESPEVKEATGLQQQGEEGFSNRQFS